MLRTMYGLVIAGAASLMLTGLVNATDLPMSVNETGPVIPQAAAPHAHGATRGGDASRPTGQEARKIVFRHPKTGDLISVTRAATSEGDFLGTAADRPRGKTAPRFHP